MNRGSAKGLALNNGHRGVRVSWRQITTEPLQCGDMWASTDPNTPGKQTGNDYNLQMQAINTACYGLRPDSGSPHTNLGNGAYWRPVSIVKL